MTDKDSLAAVVAELRMAHSATMREYADRIERLDAEMRKDNQPPDLRRLVSTEHHNEYLRKGARVDQEILELHRRRIYELEAQLAACRLLLSLPRVRALFPPLPDGAVLGSCSGDVYEA